MLKNRLGLSLILMGLFTLAAICPAQEQTQPGAQPAAGPADNQLSALTVPQLLQIAQQYREARQYADAIKYLNEIMSRESGKMDIDAMRLLGDIAWDLQRAEDAQKYWLNVRRIQPNDFGANWGLGRVNIQSGQFRNAMYYLEIANSVVPLDPPELKPQVLIELAKAYRGSGLRGKAIETAEKAKALSPRSYDVWYVLATIRVEVARSQEDLDRALGDADTLIEVAKADVSEKGIDLGGVQRLQAACQLKLGVLYAYRRIMFEPAPDGNPSNRLIPGMEDLATRVSLITVDMMLWQSDLERMARHFQIVDFINSALQYSGSRQADLLIKLGKLQAATGQIPAAIEIFKRVLNSDPANTEAKQALEQLTGGQP